MAVREHRLYSFNGNDDGDKCYLIHQAVATGMRMIESIGELTNKSPPISHPLPCTKHFPLWQSHASLPPHALHLSSFYYIVCIDITSLQPLLPPRVHVLCITYTFPHFSFQCPGTVQQCKCHLHHSWHGQCI